MTKEGGGKLAIATRFLEEDNRMRWTQCGQFVRWRPNVNSSPHRGLRSAAWPAAASGLKRNFSGVRHSSTSVLNVSRTVLSPDAARKARHVRPAFRSWRHRGAGRTE